MAETNYLIGENKSLRKFEGGGGGLVKITYDSLKTLITNSKLVEGTFYRITDYTCKVDSSQTWVKSAEHQFDIIVLATSVNTIDENAFAIQHEGDTYFQYANLNAWRLKYNIDNNTSNYCWADSTNGKGVIYYMEDEFGNKCDYDFKNILMLRYEVTASTKSEFSFSVSRIFTDQTSRTNWTINTSTKNYFYTFSFCANSDLSNLQDLSVMDGISSKAFYGNEFYSIDKAETNFQPSCMIICPSGSNTITLSGLTTFYLYYNKSLSRFKNNTFNCLNSTSSVINHSNSFGNNNSYNSFGNINYYNSFGNVNHFNSFGNGNIYWKVGNSTSCNGCFIGNYIQGTSSSYRTIDGKTRVQYWS